MSATLTARIREQLGTRPAKKLRREGRIPASIQGEGKKNLEVSIDETEFMAARRHHEHLFDIGLEGGKGKKAGETALIRELHWDTVNERILHVEFRRVVRGRKTEVEVELDFTGHPKGGVLNHLATHITVSAFPQDIPDGITVSVDELEQGDQLHAKDLVLPQNVELKVDPELAIANVTVPRGIEEVAATAEEEVPTEGAEEDKAGEAGPEGAPKED